MSNPVNCELVTVNFCFVLYPAPSTLYSQFFTTKVTKQKEGEHEEEKKVAGHNIQK